MPRMEMSVNVGDGEAGPGPSRPSGDLVKGHHKGQRRNGYGLIWVWVKIRYPNNWMVNTKLDIHICGPLGLPFWPTSICWWYCMLMICCFFARTNSDHLFALLRKYTDVFRAELQLIALVPGLWRLGVCRVEDSAIRCTARGNATGRAFRGLKCDHTKLPWWPAGNSAGSPTLTHGSWRTLEDWVGDRFAVLKTTVFRGFYSTQTHYLRRKCAVRYDISADLSSHSPRYRPFFLGWSTAGWEASAKVRSLDISCDCSETGHKMPQVAAASSLLDFGLAQFLTPWRIARLVPMWFATCHFGLKRDCIEMFRILQSLSTYIINGIIYGYIWVYMGIYIYIYIYHNCSWFRNSEDPQLPGRGALSTPYVWPCWTSILDLTSGAEPCHGLPWASLHWRPKILVRCNGLVGGFKHVYFSICIGNNNPDWRTPWFFRGVGISPSSYS